MNVKIYARAEVGFNSDYFDVTSVSIGMLNYSEPSVAPQYLPARVKVVVA